MKYEELEHLALNGKLKVIKREGNTVYREKGWRGQKWDDTSNASWDSTLIPYKMFSYQARTPNMPEHSFFKITKADFIKLYKIIK